MGIQTLIKDVSCAVETYFEETRPASCTITLYTGEGAIKINGESATVDGVSTTISAAAAAAATTVSLASASSVVSGRRYILGVTSSTAPLEVVTVKSLSGSTATLLQPLLYAHNSGDRFSCGRVTYTVPSASTDAVWWDGYAVFTPDSGDPITESVDCVKRKIPDALIDRTYLLQIFPEGEKMLGAKLDLNRALREARDKFLRDVGGRVRVHEMLAAEEFKYGAALTFWIMRRHGFGPDWIAVMDKIEEARQYEIEKLRSQVPVDAGQDGVTTSDADGGITSGILERA